MLHGILDIVINSNTLIDQTFHCVLDIVTKLDFITVFDVFPNCTCWDKSSFRTCRYFYGLCSSNSPRYFFDFAQWGFFTTFATGAASNTKSFLLRTSCPVLFGTCICSNVATIHSLTYHVYGPIQFRTSLGTSFPLQEGTFILKYKASH